MGGVGSLTRLTAVALITVAVAKTGETRWGALAGGALRCSVGVGANAGATAAMRRRGRKVGFAAVDHLCIAIVKTRLAGHEATATVARRACVGRATNRAATAAVLHVVKDVGRAGPGWVISAVLVVRVLARSSPAVARKAGLCPTTRVLANTTVRSIRKLVDFTTVVPIGVTIEIIVLAARDIASAVDTLHVGIGLRTSRDAVRAMGNIAQWIGAGVTTTQPPRGTIRVLGCVNATGDASLRHRVTYGARFAIAIRRAPHALMRRLIAGERRALRRVARNRSAITI